MAAVARQLVMSRPVGEVLLKSKLQILNGTGHRRPSIALSILTGRVAEQLSILENFYAADAAAWLKFAARDVCTRFQATAGPTVRPPMHRIFM